MLAWLATSVPAVAGALLELALGKASNAVDDIDLTTQVVVQGGRLDALLTAPTIALVVESKLGSGYGDSQLRRYVDWLADHHADRDVKALMTLTRDRAPWPHADYEHAARREVVPSERRWEDLHGLLEPFAEGSTDISGRLIREFLDMLSEEGLVPMQPLSAAEFGDVWNSSRAVVVRYHEFFRACKSAIAESLGAEIIPNSSSEHYEYTWQDYRLVNRERLVIGIWYTDEGVPIKPAVYTKAPIVWMAAEAKKWPNWEKAALWMETNPPDGWRARGKRWWGRPQVWCYLYEAVGDGSFEEQRTKLAAVCGQGQHWVDAARLSQ